MKRHTLNNNIFISYSEILTLYSNFIIYSILPIQTFCRAEGENYGDSAVGFVELKCEGCFYYIQGKVCPEYRVNSKLYSVSMFIDKENEKIEYVKYNDCAASADILKLILGVGKSSRYI